MYIYMYIHMYIYIYIHEKALRWRTPATAKHPRPCRSAAVPAVARRCGTFITSVRERDQIQIQIASVIKFKLKFKRAFILKCALTHRMCSL